jgi:DNA-binding IclR family transcriptional regulator
MSQNGIKVLHKVVQVIDVIANSEIGIKFTEIARALDMNKTTVLRILQALESYQLAARRDDRGYVLGNRLIWWESCSRRNIELLSFLQPHLEKIRDLTSETVTFNLLVQDRIVHVAEAESQHIISARFNLGYDSPLNAGASGRVVLAHLDPKARSRFLNQSSLRRLTARTITNQRRLERNLEECRTNGYAISCGERFANTNAVAIPVFDRYGKVVGGISVVGPSERMTSSRCKRIAAILVTQARLLTAQIRGNSPAFLEGRTSFNSKLGGQWRKRNAVSNWPDG